ncbi:HAD hydrolase-like protein [Gulosibacter sp. 10]|uniref:HAD hydrolase-like protein n=1 Tax=Gulosibacter sp. 10 TaxID=1255570 RepID=UPI00097EF1FA|nr:HAD hydrolase-like protein [Gulosibacter sp. 10]SJM54976.1 Phosphoglycolate phosphatase [Gulosibacter sp. 10]
MTEPDATTDSGTSRQTDDDRALDDAPLLEELDPEAEVSLSAHEAVGEEEFAGSDFSESRSASREHRGGEVDEPRGRFSPASVTVVQPRPIAPTTPVRLQQPDARPLEPRELPRGTATPPFSAVLWDLDGTISDSAPGIVAALRKTLDVFRMPIPDDETLLSYVGPPIIDTFKELHLDNAVEIHHAIETYREIHSESGLDHSPPFAGVAELVRDVHRAGIPQSTATSKPEPSALRVLHHYGILDEFDFVTGASPDESRAAKTEVVAEALARLEGKGVDLSNVIMIGDRFYDVEGSAEHGVPCIYVTWGYGRVGEDAGAAGVATNAVELRAMLGL